jgi:histidinol phosphatase-like PHP family hydrolase
MNRQPVDCHAHSTFSDGALTIDEVVERASALGVVPSIADHISRDVSRSVDSIDAVRAYLDALEQRPVLRGGEFCYHDDLWRELPEALVRRFTHRVGSLHAIELADGALLHVFSRKAQVELTPTQYLDAHVAYLERFAREMPVDILAHPTLVAARFRSAEPLALWTEEHETRLVDALHAGGIAFEISNRYPPHERLVRRAAERGLRLSLGSDGHTREQVANLANPLAMARRVGVRDEDLYDPRRHGSKTGHFVA